MITKSFEIRDSATFIPIIATQFSASDIRDDYLLSRGGWRNNQVLIFRLDDGRASVNPHYWDNLARTMYIAHIHIIENFASLENGEVIDVEYILGKKKTKKISEQYE